MSCSPSSLQAYIVHTHKNCSKGSNSYTMSCILPFKLCMHVAGIISYFFLLAHTASCFSDSIRVLVSWLTTCAHAARLVTPSVLANYIINRQYMSYWYNIIPSL